MRVLLTAGPGWPVPLCRMIGAGPPAGQLIAVDQARLATPSKVQVRARGPGT